MLLTVFEVELGGIELSSAADRHFRLDERGETIVLEVVYRGGYLARTTSYSLRSDGRLRIEVRSPDHGAGPMETLETRVPEQELLRLVSGAVEGGLLEFDSRLLGERAVKLNRRYRRALDSTWVTVTFRLEELELPDGSNVGPVLRSFNVSRARDLANAYPEIVEYRAAADLLEWIQERHRVLVKPAQP